MTSMLRKSSIFGIVMRVIGITGGICSGKSTITSILHSDLGVHVIDADKLGHLAYEKGSPCYFAILKAFEETERVTETETERVTETETETEKQTQGHKLLDPQTGEIDRRALGAIVFSSRSAMERLQSIVWPEIRRRAECQLKEIELEREAQGGEREVLCVLEAAVMIEAGWQDIVQSLWVVNVNPETAVERLMKRNRLSESDARARLAAQLTNEERNKFADHIIVNEGLDLTSLRATVVALLDEERKKESN